MASGASIPKRFNPVASICLIFETKNILSLEVDNSLKNTEISVEVKKDLGLRNKKTFEIFGKKNDHLKIDFKNKKGQRISAIGFFMKAEDFPVKIENGEKINLLANLEKSYFGGREELRLRIVGIR